MGTSALVHEETNIGTIASSSDSITISASQELLVLVSSVGATNEMISTVTVDGNSMTAAIVYDNPSASGGDRSVEMWYLFNPPSGTVTAVITWAGSGTVNPTFSYVEHSGYGLDTSSGLGATNSANDDSATDDTPTVSLTTTKANSLIAIGVSSGPNANPYADASTPSATEYSDQAGAGGGGGRDHWHAVIPDASTVGSKTCAATQTTADEWAIVAAEFKLSDSGIAAAYHHHARGWRKM